MAGALAFAEGTLSGLRGASPEHDALLRDVVALIAYQQPEQVGGKEWLAGLGQRLLRWGGPCCLRAARTGEATELEGVAS